MTLRVLPDLVVMPTYISLDTGDGASGDEVDLVLVVRIQGGWAVGEVEVTFEVDGEEAGKTTIGAIGVYATAKATLVVTLEAGNMTVRASAYSVEPIEEKSLQNNEAETIFVIEEGEDGPEFGELLPAIAVVIIGVVIFLAALMLYVVVVGSQKD